MERKRKAPPRPARPARKAMARGDKRVDSGQEELLQDALTARAKEGDVEAFLALVRFHSTFNPIPMTRDLLLVSGLDEVTRHRLIGRLKRKEDSLLRPFPSVDMMFWGEPWVQAALNRFLWKKRGRKPVPDEEFLRKLWDATREGAVLQLEIYRKANVAPSAWVRVKYPHYENLGLSDAQILKVARAEGCRFDESGFENAIRRFRRKG